MLSLILLLLYLLQATDDPRSVTAQLHNKAVV